MSAVSFRVRVVVACDHAVSGADIVTNGACDADDVDERVCVGHWERRDDSHADAGVVGVSHRICFQRSVNHCVSDSAPVTESAGNDDSDRNAVCNLDADANCARLGRGDRVHNTDGVACARSDSVADSCRDVAANGLSNRDRCATEPRRHGKDVANTVHDRDAPRPGFRDADGVVFIGVNAVDDGRFYAQLDGGGDAVCVDHDHTDGDSSGNALVDRDRDAAVALAYTVAIDDGDRVAVRHAVAVRVVPVRL